MSSCHRDALRRVNARAAGCASGQSTRTPSGSLEAERALMTHLVPTNSSPPQRRQTMLTE